MWAKPFEINNAFFWYRDLPLSLVIAVSSVTGLYIMMNVAYFTVLTPEEFIASNSVAGVRLKKYIFYEYLPNVVYT